jgi:SAM-dependent methyltransferase
MCHSTCEAFVRTVIARDMAASKRVLEVGAQAINGSTRAHIEAMAPASYMGVDIQAGPGVDAVVDVVDLVDRFGPESFDLVVSTEMLEHVRDWRGAINAMKSVLVPGGHLVLTTRSKGFYYHGYPHDYWRYEVDDFALMFGDMEIRALEADPSPDHPGVFLWATRTGPPAELKDLELWSIVTKRRQREISERELRAFRRRKNLRRRVGRVIPGRIRAARR